MKSQHVYVSTSRFLMESQHVFVSTSRLINISKTKGAADNVIAACICKYK